MARTDSLIYRSTPTQDLAVVYLARHAEGAAAVRRFAASYQRHSAGIAHDLVILRKGFPADAAALNELLAALPGTQLDVSDEGFDISAYAAAASQLPHRHLVFLNTFSEIAADDWLRKLYDAVSDASVGAAGAAGSYESALTSMRRLKKGLFLAQSQFTPSLSILRSPFQFIRRLLPKHLSRYLVNLLIGRLMARRDKVDDSSFPDADFEAFWIEQTTAEGTYDYLSAMPEFPNPHLRTNGFIIERRLFLNLVPDAIASKTQSYLFESGAESLTAQLLRRGLKVVVVGRDGVNYDIDQWARSRTYRLGDQSNLLIHDNQTRAYENLDSVGKATFAAMAWGEAPTPQR